MTDENSESESDTEEKLKGENRNWRICVRLFLKCNNKMRAFIWVSVGFKKNVLPCLSSQPAVGFSPVHAEADGQVPHLGERSDGAAGEETF